MTLQDKLTLVSYAKRFDIDRDNDGIAITHKTSNIVASIDVAGNIMYYVTGVYNSSLDWEEIDMQALSELQEFCLVLKGERK